MRVLYELAHRPDLTASDLVRELALDAGYVSRILRRFEQRQWVARRPAPHDARQQLLTLTPAGHAAFAPLQQRSRDEAAALLAPLPPAVRPRLVGALAAVQRLLDPPPTGAKDVQLRDLRPGDLGWVIGQHGALYAAEYGYSLDFEALVAEIAARFVRRFDPRWDKAWIAEAHGRRVGCVFVARRAKTVAQLRLLILLPEARGLGLGARLTDEAIAFARACGYRKLVLWTNGQLHAARAIYRARGFACVKKETMAAYGRKRLVSETWERRL